MVTSNNDKYCVHRLPRITPIDVINSLSLRDALWDYSLYASIKYLPISFIDLIFTISLIADFVVIAN